MTDRILVIPDVHGLDFWKEPVAKYANQVDKIIFLGDYLDPYPENGVTYSCQELMDNLMDIIELKQSHMDNVVLLKGNHDQHYASERFRELAKGSRFDNENWNLYADAFTKYKSSFKIIHCEVINGTPYLFSHAGLTINWINKVNSVLWRLPDNKISVVAPDIIDRINALDNTPQGQEMLAIVGRYRSLFGARSGSVLWADIEEHFLPDAPKAYG